MNDDCMNTLQRAREEVANILACALLDMILAGNDPEGEIFPGRTGHQEEIQEQPACH